jgi:desulfoferrodoxin (superoxide reductase-like protein)
MRLSAVLLLALLACAFSSTTVGYADVPTVQSLRVETRGSQTVLVMEVRHAQPSSTHYIDTVEVQVGDATIVMNNLGSQTDAVFTVERVLESSSGAIRARAHCNLHGWSQWRQLGDGGGASSGIPGYPPISVVAAVLGVSLLLARRVTRRAA